MIKYKGFEIFAVNTLGEWFAQIHSKDGQLYETLGYLSRDNAIEMAKIVVEGLYIN